MLLRRIQSDVDRLLITRKLQVVAVCLVFARDHLQLNGPFRNRREMGDALLICSDFPMNFAALAKLGNATRAEEVQNHGGVIDGLVVLILHYDFQRRLVFSVSRYGCKKREKKSEESPLDLHALIIA